MKNNKPATRESWLIISSLFFLGFLISYCYGQASVGVDQPPIGAHRVFSRSNFQCNGRPAGYYADVGSGCQVYHMCDGLGRQFSYSCPNTTLFQQRMLICDHWYMVNCSRAESNYGANLLIGQRDKPFVPEDENELRTPRPDLLDRPYAPDYSGESFRNQYKSLPSLKNVIPGIELKKQNIRKSGQIQSVELTNKLENKISRGNSGQFKSNVIAEKSDISEIKQNSQSLPYYENQSRKTNSNLKTLPVIRRNGEVEPMTKMYPSVKNIRSDDNDLRVASSQDGARTEDENNFYTTLSSFQNQRDITLEGKTRPSVNYSVTTKSLPSTTITQVNKIKTTVPPTSQNVKTTRKNYEFPKFINGSQLFKNSPQSNSDKFESRILTGSKPLSNGINTTQLIKQQFNQISNGQLNQFHPVNILNSNTIHEPPSHLLPPFTNLNIADDSTTQGPAIYYEWKIPSSGLEPPIYTEEARTNSGILSQKNMSELVEPVLLTNETNNFNIYTPANGLQPPRFENENEMSSDSISNSKAESTKITVTISPATIKNPTVRSITGAMSQHTFDVKITTTEKENIYSDLKKRFLIPDYTLPIDSNVHNSYGDNNAKNSFQIKIPERRSDKPWYGENAECPECHPSFLKPGTCEPCIKIR